MNYIACEDLDMLWKTEDVETFRQMYKEGTSLEELAKHFKRNPDEIALLIIDHGNKGLLKGRKKR